MTSGSWLNRRVQHDHRALPFVLAVRETEQPPGCRYRAEHREVVGGHERRGDAFSSAVPIETPEAQGLRKKRQRVDVFKGRRTLTDVEEVRVGIGAEAAAAA
jgi:hypothetical protein